MADSLVASAESNSHSEKSSETPAPKSDATPSLRKIDFYPAKNPFAGFSNGGGGFRFETLNPTSSDPQRLRLGCGSSAFAGKKPDGSELLDVGLDPEHSFGITFTFRRIGAGLENLGNTCFLNSVLQCLTYTEPLAAYLQSGKHQNSCRTAGFCALCAIQKHVSRALQLTGRSLAPKDLVSNLRCISRNFRNARQEDAHEYMVNLLESMHKCCLPSGVPSESPSAYEKSLVHKIFGGCLRSQVKCAQCSFCSNKFDPFLDLSLEINKAESLCKALSHFTAAEYLDGGERQYQCQQCKQKVKARKQLTIHKAPYVLTIHLKRFGAHQLGQKIDTKVHFGRTLDLKPYVSGPYDGDLKYTLYGVLVHAGWSTHSGHYYCYVRTSTGIWYSLDDHQVRPVSEKIVLEQKAYMLFYVRDRRKIALKKPVDVIQKQSMMANAVGIKTYCSPSQGLKYTVQNGPIDKRVDGVSHRDGISDSNKGLKETVQNGPAGRRINGLDSSASATQRDKISNSDQGSKETVQNGSNHKIVNGVDYSSSATQRETINADPLKGTLINEASIENINSLMRAECSALKKDPGSDITLKVPMSKDAIQNGPSDERVDGITQRDGISNSNQSLKETFQNGSTGQRVNSVDSSASATPRDEIFNSDQCLKETVQNGPTDKMVNGLDSSSSATHREAINADPLKETLMNEVSIQNINSLMRAESSALKKDSLSDIPLKAPVTKDELGGLSTLNPNGSEGFTQSAPIKSSDGILNSASFATTGSNFDECSKEKGIKEDLGRLVVVAPSFCASQNLITKKYPDDGVAELPSYDEDKSTNKDLSHSIATTPDYNGPGAGNVCIADKTSHKDYNVKGSQIVDPLRSLEWLCHENNQTEGFSKESTLGDIRQIMGVIESGLQNTNISLRQEVLDHKCQKKNKLSKCQFTSMRLGSRILFRASLSLRKKKHKKIKRRTRKFNNLPQEDLLDIKCSPKDLGPSTSEITGTLSLGGTVHSRRKGLKSHSSKNAKNDKISRSGLVEGVIDDESRGRLGQNGAVPPMDMQPQRSCSSPSAGNQRDSRGDNGSKDSRRNSVQTNFVSMLTRGREEEFVARWDGIALHSSQITEPAGEETVGIGYIADEWDVEYDRGKRKKVRSSNSDFGGPNPFQALATKNTKLKKMKMDQSSSGNRPFRI